MLKNRSRCGRIWRDRSPWSWCRLLQRVWRRDVTVRFHRVPALRLGFVPVLSILALLITACGGLPDSVSHLDKACGGATYDAATPYAGPPPHHVAVFMPTEVGQLDSETPELSDRSAVVESYEEPTAVQLVACGTVEGEQRSSDCGGYIGLARSIPMVRATYRIRVYELRTHRGVRSVVVKGADTACPQYVSANYTPKRFLSGLTDAQWQSVLDDLVE